MRLLVTRPEPQGERTVAVLRARGHDALLCPLLRIEPVDDADLGGACAAVLMTSANAARALAVHGDRAALLRLPAFVVGQRTAEAARAVGFARVISADGAVGDLAQLVADQFPARAALLYLAGEDRAGNLAGQLSAAGFSVRTAVVYRAVPAAALPEDITRQLRTGAIAGVLHFSRRSAETFLAALKAAGIPTNSLNCKHYCLSSQVAGPLTEAGVGPILLADRPEEAAVLDLVGVA